MKVYELQRILGEIPSGYDVKIRSSAWNEPKCENIKSAEEDFTESGNITEQGSTVFFDAPCLDFDPSELATPVD